MYGRKLLVPMILLGSIALAAGTSAEERRGPRISVDEPRHDFGTVRPGARAEHVFTVRNTGDESLQIEQVLPG